MAPKRTVIKQAANAGWLILSRTLALTAFGLVLNWGLFGALGLGIWGRYCDVGAFGAHASGPGAILAVALIALICSRSLILSALFLVLFPFLYLMVGKSRGIQSALAYLTKDNRAWIHEMLKPVLQSALQFARTESGDGTAGGRVKTVGSLVSRKLDQSEDLPRPMRWLLKGLLKKLKIARLIEEAKGLTQDGGSEEAILGRLRSRIDQGIDEKMKAGWGAAGMLLLANVIFAGAVYWLVRR
jgi:hypothetical protein